MLRTNLSSSLGPVLRTAASEVTGKGWHPGHYVKTQGDHSDTDQDDYFDSIISGSSFARSHEIAEMWGVFVAFAWGTLETTLGVYDWTRLDTMIAAIEANNGKFGHNYYIGVNVEWKNFGQEKKSLSSQADHAAQLVPDNITSDGNIYPRIDEKDLPGFPDDPTTVGGYNTAVWETNVMDQFIDFMQAFADRYDDNPTVEVVFTTETALGWKGSAPSGYSDTKYDTQIGRMIEALGPMFTKTNVALGWNFGLWRSNTSVPSGNPVDEADLMELCFQNSVGIHSPDTDSTSDKSLLFRGDGSGYGVTPIRDYRATIYKSDVISAPNLGGKDDLGSASNALELHAKVIPNTHIFWVTTSNKGPAYDWDAVKAAILAETSPLTSASACPTQYDSCNT